MFTNLPTQLNDVKMLEYCMSVFFNDFNFSDLNFVILNFMCICLYRTCRGACGNQKRALDSLELEFCELLFGCWEPNPDLVQEQ